MRGEDPVQGSDTVGEIRSKTGCRANRGKADLKSVIGFVSCGAAHVLCQLTDGNGNGLVEFPIGAIVLEGEHSGVNTRVITEADIVARQLELRIKSGISSTEIGVAEGAQH